MTGDLERLRRWDTDAVEGFYRQHAATVLGWVIRLGGPKIDAEDVAHQVFEVALNRIHTFRGESTPRTWLFGITRRVVANARRRAAIWSFLSLDAITAASGTGDPEWSAQSEGERRLVQQALEELTDALREVVVLVDLEERPATEVAELLGVPVGTVYSRVHHARKAFGVALARRGILPEHLAAVGRAS